MDSKVSLKLWGQVLCLGDKKVGGAEVNSPGTLFCWGGGGLCFYYSQQPRLISTFRPTSAQGHAVCCDSRWQVSLLT